MHIEGTKSDTDNLLSIDRKSRVGVFAMHGNLKLRGVREFFSSHLYITSLNDDNSSVQSSQVAGISVRSEDQTTFDNDGVELGSRVDIYE
jgi:hypothetical protein